jgi:hypothetical protein
MAFLHPISPVSSRPNRSVHVEGDALTKLEGEEWYKPSADVVIIDTEMNVGTCRSIYYCSIMKPYCLGDISPSRADTHRYRSCGYRWCYVNEQYVSRIGYVKGRVRTERYVCLPTTQSGC